MSGEKNKNNTFFKIILTSIVFVIVGLSIFLVYSLTHPTRISFTSPFIYTPPAKEISILIFGDLMLDRGVYNRIHKIGFDKFFEGIASTTKENDIVVANLEGPFTPYPSITTNLINKELRFTFDPIFIPKLANLGINVLGLANNHTLNFGREGLRSTREYLRQAHISYYGDPNNNDELSTIVEKKGIKVGFIGFHEFSYINFDKVLAEIDRIRPDVDILIISPHWGVEYESVPTETMKKWARQFIDHGADAVIGSHPHVVGNMDEYRGKKILYSLGNFVFDQYFSEDTMNGLSVKIRVEKDVQKGRVNSIELTYTLIPIRIDTKGVSLIYSQ